MDQRKKWVLGILVLIVLVLIGVAVSKKGNQQMTDETGPIKIGVIGPLTGDAASYGEPRRNVLQLAADEINASGGIDGRLIELIFEDSQCTGSLASNAASKLINVDKVKVIIGGFCSSESLAAVPIVEKNKVLLISDGSSSPDLTGISKFFVRDNPSDATQGSSFAETAHQRNGWKKVAIIQETTDYAAGVAKAFSSKFVELGGVVVSEEFPSTQKDFRTALTKLKVETPDALLVSVQTPSTAEVLLKNVKDLGWNVVLMISDTIGSDPVTIERNKNLLEGALISVYGIDPSNELFKKLSGNYKSKYGVELPFPPYAQTEYDAVYMLADGIREVGYNAEKLAEWFRSVKDWKGASGIVDIDENGDRVGGHTVKVIKNGIVEELK